MAADPWEVGRKVLVLYDTEDVWHERILLLRTTEEVMKKVTKASQLGSGAFVYWVLTPDGDIYPEELERPAVRFALCTGDDESDPRRRLIGRAPPFARRQLSEQSGQLDLRRLCT
jgi:hypothetical protein